MRAGRPGAHTALASAYLQKARATGDTAYYARAEALLREALRRDARDASAVVELGTLAASRHDFRSALRRARRARELAPGSLEPYPLLVDALVELGRYGAAERALQRFADLRPGLPAYARVSYLRELRGDLDGAAAAMRLAVAAGAAAPEDAAAAQVLLGDLELARGRLGAAGRQYAIAHAGAPDFVPVLAARARLRAARGDLRGAIAAMRRVTARLPLPEHVIALGELQLAAGRRDRGRARDARPRRRRARAAGRRRRRHGRGDRAVRGRPRRPAAGAAARAAGVARGAERAVGRRDGLGADRERAAAGGHGVDAARAAARLARPGDPRSTRG